MPIDSADVLYVGSAVSTINESAAASGGCAPMAAAAGAGDTTDKTVPFGIVVGTNNRTPLFNTTYQAEYITDVQSQAAQIAREYTGQEGMWSKGDPMAFVEVGVIGMDSLIKGRIYNAAFGTAITVNTVTTGSATGAGFTADAGDFTPISHNAIWYCRSGANMGLYRSGTDTSTTVHTFDTYWPYDISIGDTFVGVQVGLGTVRGQFDSESTYIDNGADQSANYYAIDVLEVHLEEAGNEYCIFKFNADSFCRLRA